MRIVHKNIDKVFDFSQNRFQHIIIENPKEFFSLGNELYRQCLLNDAGNWILSEDEILNLPKETLFISDYFDLNFNTKRIRKLIDDEIEKELNYNDYFEAFSKINLILTNLNADITQRINLPIQYNNDFTISDFIKFSNYKIEEDICFIERLTSYIDIFVKLRNIKLVIFVNLSAYITSEEIKELQKYLTYANVVALFLDGEVCEIPKTEKTIIDKDLCLI